MIDPRSKTTCAKVVSELHGYMDRSIAVKEVIDLKKKKTRKQSMKMIIETLQFWAEKERRMLQEEKFQKKDVFADGKKKAWWKPIMKMHLEQI